MNRKADIVFETSALLAFADDSPGVMEELSIAARSGLIVAVPVTCIMEVYQETPPSRHAPFEALMRLDCVWPWLLGSDDAPIVGNLAYHRGVRAGLAHAIWIATTNAATFVGDADTEDLLPPGWPRAKP